MQKVLRVISTRPKTSLSISVLPAGISYSLLRSQPPVNQYRSPLQHIRDNHQHTPPTMTSSGTTPQWPTKSYTSKNTHFPYTAQDLQPMDTSPDSAFYSTPRFVTHIDDHAISVLREYYSSVLPHSSPATSTTTPTAILDLCSSWISHYPPILEQAVASGAVIVAGMGMNADELDANPLFGRDAGKRYLTQDLNETPTIPPFNAIRATTDSDDDAGPTPALVSASTLTVSIDYLTAPVAVLKALLERTEEGGAVHVAVSNRCFPTKAVRRWLRVSEEERLEMVAEMLVWGGWVDVEILCLCNGSVVEEEEGEGGGDAGASSEGALHRLLSGMGMAGAAGRRVDPLWVVRGRKRTGGG